MTTGMKGFLWVSDSRQRCKMLKRLSLILTFQINRFPHLTLFCPFFSQVRAISLDFSPLFPSIRDCFFSILVFSSLLIPFSLTWGREEFGSKAFSSSKIFIVFNLNWILKKAGDGVERDYRVHTLIRRILRQVMPFLVGYSGHLCDGVSHVKRCSSRHGALHAPCFRGI